VPLVAPFRTSFGVRARRARHRAGTKHDPAGSTNAHAWPATTPWSANDLDAAVLVRELAKA